MKQIIAAKRIDNLIKLHEDGNHEMIGAYVKEQRLITHFFIPKTAILLLDKKKLVLIRLGIFTNSPIQTKKYRCSEIKEIKMEENLLNTKVDILLDNTKRIRLKIYRFLEFSYYQKNIIEKLRKKNYKTSFLESMISSA
ncbi:hypothetical protein [Flavobacterium sp. '19STA2R22 D10 B1']|uniref:hypothetical protein n=1 Tax=Flavobacterium aerium TaxID=3037261 RepID=UPI00278BDC18|nr:hypothetical protein [Flavobacterium sp. '19STA2R22 D10 B1']